MRTYYDAHYIAAFMRNPVIATLELDYGWRPRGGDPRWTFGHLRAWAEVELRRRAATGEPRDAALCAVIDTMLNGTGWAGNAYAELERTAPATRYVMQPDVLIQAIVAYADYAYEELVREASSAKYSAHLEVPWQVLWQPHEAQRPRWLAGRFDIVSTGTDSAGRTVTRVWELKSTSKAVDSTLLRQYANSWQSRLYSYAVHAHAMNASVLFSIWSIGGKASGYMPRFVPATEFLYGVDAQAETQAALANVFAQIACWERQDFEWAETFGQPGAMPLPWQTTPAAAWGDVWEELFALHPRERPAFVAERFERRKPWDPVAWPEETVACT